MAGLLSRAMEGMGIRDRNAYKDATGATIDDTEEMDPETLAHINASREAIERSYQGVTKGPQGPGASKAGFIAEQLRKGKDQTTAQRMADQIYGK